MIILNVIFAVIFYGFIAATVGFLIVNTPIFNKVRNASPNFIKSLISCPICIAFWITMLLSYYSHLGTVLDLECAIASTGVALILLTKIFPNDR